MSNFCEAFVDAAMEPREPPTAITPSMIIAGVAALRGKCPFDSAFPFGGEDEAVEAVLKAALGHLVRGYRADMSGTTAATAIDALDVLKKMISDNAEELATKDAENMARYSDDEISLARTLQQFADINYVGDVAPLYLMLAKKLIDHDMIRDAEYFYPKGRPVVGFHD